MIRKFNDWLAVTITKGMATMWCAYIFSLEFDSPCVARSSKHSLLCFGGNHPTCGLESHYGGTKRYRASYGKTG